MYEYNNIFDAKNLFVFSNVKPDYINEDLKHRPLSFRRYLTTNPEVLKYFDKNLQNQLIYYCFENNKFSSVLYVVDNEYIKQENLKITSIQKVEMFLKSMNMKFRIIHKNVNLNNYEIIINNVYPATLHTSKNLFYIEIFANETLAHEKNKNTLTFLLN